MGYRDRQKDRQAARKTQTGQKKELEFVYSVTKEIEFRF